METKRNLVLEMGRIQWCRHHKRCKGQSQNAPLRAKNLQKNRRKEGGNQEKEEKNWGKDGNIRKGDTKSGKTGNVEKGNKREDSFTDPILTNRDGNALRRCRNYPRWSATAHNILIMMRNNIPASPFFIINIGLIY